MRTAASTYDAQRLAAMREHGPNAQCAHGMPLYEGCYSCLMANTWQPAPARAVREMMAQVDRMIDMLPPPPPNFRRGQLAAVNDEPYEVVMHKGDTVYVKDENGKVTGHPAAWVTAL